MKDYCSIFLKIFNKTIIYMADVSNLIPKKEGHLYNLPDGDISTHFIPRFIDILIKISYTIAVAVMVYAGILYIKSQGDDTDQEKAKDIFIFGIIGFLVIVISYAFVQGVMRLNFFN